MDTIRISGKMINLQLLSKNDLKLWITNQPEFSKKLKLKIDSEPLNDNLKKIFRIKIEKMDLDPNCEDWYSYFAIILNDTIIGTIGSKGKPNINNSIEVGYGISDKYYNQGYTTEALRLFCNYFFKNHDIDSIIAETQQNNISSQNVLKKNGFEIIDEGDYQLWELLNPSLKII